MQSTIEVKNEELKELKLKAEPDDSFLGKPINLAYEQGDTEKSQFPFHNPLFGDFSTKQR